MKCKFSKIRQKKKNKYVQLLYIFIRMPKQTGKRKTCETSARRTHKLISLLNTKVDLLQDSINMVNDNVNTVIDTLENKAGSAYLTPLLTQGKSGSDSMTTSSNSEDIVASPPRDESMSEAPLSEESGMNEESGMSEESGMNEAPMSEESGMSNVTSPSETEDIIASPPRDESLGEEQFSDLSNPSDTVSNEVPSVYESPMPIESSSSETRGGRRRHNTNKRQQRRQRNSKKRNRRM
jgi:hypothetical protein